MCICICVCVYLYVCILPELSKLWFTNSKWKKCVCVKNNLKKNFMQNENTTLAGCLSWFERWPIHQTGCGFNPRSGHIPMLQVQSPVRAHTRGNQSMLFSLPSSLSKINKHILGWGFKKKKKKKIPLQVFYNQIQHSSHNQKCSWWGKVT